MLNDKFPRPHQLQAAMTNIQEFLTSYAQSCGQEDEEAMESDLYMIRDYANVLLKQAKKRE